MNKEKFKKKSNNYVCPKCFNKINKCVCNLAPHGLIQVDERLQNFIRECNKNNIKTISCCSGHYEEINNRFGTNIHIQFLKPFYSCPTGFCVEDGNSIEGWRVIRHTFNKELTKEEFNREQEICVNNLMIWLRDRIEEA